MPTAHEEVLADLGPRIVDGLLAPGEALTLDAIRADYKVSRTVAREVVQVLASMGLVESRRRTGVTVMPEERWDHYAPSVIRWRLAGPGRGRLLHQLAQLRAAVEPTSASLAAAHATPEVRRRLLRLADELERTGAAGDLQAFLELDVTFHRLLLDGTGNPMFRALGEVVEEVLRGRTDHDLMPAEPAPEARRLHAEVARAVAAGEAEAARAAMHAICAEVVGQLRPD
ncbi:MAG: FCD domain-containing protein [Propionibacteriales bacterium]|nr:FCD domain-containing protein [Propionibacteriales bacterium]